MKDIENKILKNKNIEKLSITTALFLWDTCVPQDAKNSLRFEYVYDSPQMTQIFDEGEQDELLWKEMLKKLHTNSKEIVLFFQPDIAFVMTWEVLCNCWDDIFDYPNDALIITDDGVVYAYVDMALQRWNFDNPVALTSFAKLKENTNLYSKEDLLSFWKNNVPFSVEEYCLKLFHNLWEGLKSIKNEEYQRKYLDYLTLLVGFRISDVLLANNPYNKDCLDDLAEFFSEGVKSQIEQEDFKNLLFNLIQSNKS